MASLDIWVEPETIGDWMVENPEGAVDVLAAMAIALDDDVKAVEHFTQDFAAYHSGSNAHQRIAPLLRLLADALEAEETKL